MSTRSRKILAATLIVIGGLLMWLVPEVSTVGFVMLLAGVATEAVGIYLEHRGDGGGTRRS